MRHITIALALFTCSLSLWSQAKKQDPPIKGKTDGCLNIQNDNKSIVCRVAKLGAINNDKIFEYDSVEGGKFRVSVLGYCQNTQPPQLWASILYYSISGQTNGMKSINNAHTTSGAAATDCTKAGSFMQESILVVLPPKGGVALHLNGGVPDPNIRNIYGYYVTVEREP